MKHSLTEATFGTCDADWRTMTNSYWTLHSFLFNLIGRDKEPQVDDDFLEHTCDVIDHLRGV